MHYETSGMSAQTGLFITLFRGRGDVYGHEDGRCVKAPLTPEVFQNHLDGIAAIGVYPMVPLGNGHGVVWGCSDIDVDDYAGACRIRDALRAAGVSAFIERSRSKGYHVWVFCEGIVPAADMRRMLMAAHIVADYPAREVNPKQEVLARGQYGNYVRLPYYNAADMTTPHRRVLDESGVPMSLDAFLGAAMATRVKRDAITALAAMYQPPVVAPTVVRFDTPTDVRDALRGLSPLGKVIWRDGPLAGRDRSGTLTKLAYECAKSGMSPSATKAVLVDADVRWGKYHLRPNGELEIDKLVVRVFA
jgi:hypothetical protein